jgi:DNA polymerase-3 subunit epsilon
MDVEHSVSGLTAGDPAGWDDLFVREVDGEPVNFVRPSDTDRPCWGVYGGTGGTYLGTVDASRESGGLAWRTQGRGEVHARLDDVVRALRRPASWPRECGEVSRWAQRLLADETLLAVDVESTGLSEAYAVQIAATARDGSVLFDRLVRPLAEIEPGAVAVHGITPERVADAPTFADVLPELTALFVGRTVVAYKVEFDRGVLERELVRHGGDTAARDWLARCRWEDAMVPWAVWQGLWSVKRGAYRNQPLGGPHEAVADCRQLLARLEEMAHGRAAS